MNSGIVKIQYKIIDCMPPKPGYTTDLTTFNRDKAINYWKQGFKIQTRQVVYYSNLRMYPETRWETHKKKVRNGK